MGGRMGRRLRVLAGRRERGACDRASAGGWLRANLGKRVRLGECGRAGAVERILAWSYIRFGLVAERILTGMRLPTNAHLRHPTALGSLHVVTSVTRFPLV